MTFTQMLAAAWRKNDSLLSVGLDPDPAKIPAHLKRGGERDDIVQVLQQESQRRGVPFPTWADAATVSSTATE